MQGKKVDRRVKYTKMVLKESFINLLGEKDISRITVKEICEDADINRSTFYTHYNDQYDLMHQIQNELFENIETYLDAYIKTDTTMVPVGVVEKIFAYIEENAPLCRLLLGERGDLIFQKRVFGLVYKKIISDLTKSGAVSKENAEYIYAFTITGCIGVIQKWLDDGMLKSPRFMAETVLRLTAGLPGW